MLSRSRARRLLPPRRRRSRSLSRLDRAPPGPPSARHGGSLERQVETSGARARARAARGVPAVPERPPTAPPGTDSWPRTAAVRSSPRPRSSSRRRGRCSRPRASSTTSATATAAATRSFSSHGGEKLGLLVLGETLEGRGRFTDAIADGVWLICEESFWGVPAHVGAQKRGRRAARRHRADRRPVRRRDGRAPRLDRLPGRRPARRRPPARARAAPRSRSTAASSRRPRARRLLVDGPSRRRGQQLEPVDQLELAGRRAAARAGSGSGGRARWRRSLAASTASSTRTPTTAAATRGRRYWGRAGRVALRGLELLHAGDGRRRRRLPRAGRPGDRPLHRGRPRRGRLVREHRRRARPGSMPEPRARLPLRPRDGRRGPRRVRRLARRAPRRVRPGDVGHSAASPARCRRCSTRAGSCELRPAEPLPGEVWLPDLQMMAARERPGTSEGLYVAAWGGHNGQSHNHNDVGNVIVYRDGRPLLVDAGVGEYTAKTFSPQRYEIWTMQSGGTICPRSTAPTSGTARRSAPATSRSSRTRRRAPVARPRAGLAGGGAGRHGTAARSRSTGGAGDRPRRELRARRVPRAAAAPLPAPRPSPTRRRPAASSSGRVASRDRPPGGRTSSRTTRGSLPRASRRRRSRTRVSRRSGARGSIGSRSRPAAARTGGRHRFVVRPEWITLSPVSRPEWRTAMERRAFLAASTAAAVSSTSGARHGGLL